MSTRESEVLSVPCGTGDSLTHAQIKHKTQIADSRCSATNGTSGETAAPPPSPSTPILDTAALDDLVELLAARLASRMRIDADRLLCRRELAARLSCSERSISDAVARGELPPPLRPAAGLVRWSWPTVLKHLEARSARQRRRGRGIYRRKPGPTARAVGKTNGRAETLGESETGA